MKPIVAFYQKVLQLIDTHSIQLDERRHKGIHLELIGLYNKSLRTKNPVTWKGGHDANVLSGILSINDKDLDDETWCSISREFKLAAFRDLSPLRTEDAMKVWGEIQKITTLDEELVLWSRNTIKRDDGSGVLILHASDLKEFERVLHRTLGRGMLKRGFLDQGMVVEL